MNKLDTNLQVKSPFLYYSMFYPLAATISKKNKTPHPIQLLAGLVYTSQCGIVEFHISYMNFLFRLIEGCAISLIDGKILHCVAMSRPIRCSFDQSETG